jgi:hypothetical protein
MLISQTKEEVRLAGAIYAHATLEAVHLVSCSASAANGADLSSFIEPFSMALVRSDAESRGVSDRMLTIDLHFAVESRDSSDPRRTIFSIGSTFRLAYRLEDGIEPEESNIRAFMNGNAIFNCWPYLREFTQNLSARMGHFPPLLPLLLVGSKSEDHAERERSDQVGTPEKRHRKKAPRHR